VTLSGICNTDLEIVKGYGGFSGTIGHEFVGVVEDAPDRPDLEGKRVVGEINAGCGICQLCVSGDPRHCPNRTVLGIVSRDGAHADFLRLPSSNLVAIPDTVSDELAVFTEPLAAAYGITEQVPIDAATRTAVIGDGKLGLLCALSLAHAGGHVTLVGKHPFKMEIAAKRGVKGMLKDEMPSSLHSQFDLVVEASGSESGFATALDLVRPRGKIVLKSTFHGTPAWEASRVVVDEITIVGSRCGRFPAAVELLASGSIDPSDLISDVLPLADGIDAMQLAGQKGVLKVLLRP